MSTKSDGKRLQLHGVLCTYTVADEIGSGGFGTVYKATVAINGTTVTGNDGANKFVALKRFKGYKKQRFGLSLDSLREIKLLRELTQDHEEQSQHIMALEYDKIVADPRDQGFWLVCEYCGQDLAAWIGKRYLGQEGSLEATQAKKFMLQILKAVDFLHKRWVLHRDLKPGNILVSLQDGEYRLKLCDFGTARHFGYHECVFADGAVTTHQYCAPELFLGARRYGAAADMWSIGCIFVELSYATRGLGAKFAMQAADSFPPQGRSKEDTYFYRLTEIVSAMGHPADKAPGWNYHAFDRNLVERLEKSRPGQSRDLSPRIVTEVRGADQIFRDLLLSENQLLQPGLLHWNPAKRATAEQALRVLQG